MAPVRTTDKDPQPDSSEPKQRRKPGRVPVSCAECRRLKLRCDRQVPCESCTKRGCAALCPDGSLPTTKGPKLKAAAEVEELKDRIGQLEAALRTMQSSVSEEPHPLLRDSPNAASSPASDSNSDGPAQASSSSTGQSTREDSSTDDVEEVLDSFGTLTLGNRGEARFFGQTSRTEYLIHAPERLTPLIDQVKLPRLSQIAIDEACKELDVFCNNPQIGDEVVACMPTMDEALRLVEIFLECSKFMWYPLPREYIYTEVVQLVYRPPIDNYCHVTKKHALALLFIIFALATLFDTNMPPYAAEAQEYYLLARISLRWAPPSYDTTLTALQAMLLMAQFLETHDCEPAHTGSHKSWIQTRNVASLGYSIGLHIASGKWQLDEAATARRARVFWQIFTQDTWLAFGFGRPPSINLAYIDCEIPQPENVTGRNDRFWSTAFHVWTWQYAKMLHGIMVTAWGARAPSYAKIMELDKRVRDFSDPPPAEGEEEEVTRTMQTLFATLYKETTHLNLHRPYLSQALKDCPEDPLHHRYGASVMIIYRSAWRVISAVQSAYKIAPALTARISLFWSHTLACAILLCLLITRASSSNLANPALVELDKICDLFEEASSQSQIAANNIHVLRKLRKQAHAAMTKAPAEDAAAVEAELDRLGGKTQLVKTVGEFRLHWACSPPRGRVPQPKPVQSVFEVASNPNGILQPVIAQDTRTFDDVDLLTDPQFSFDFLNGAAGMDLPGFDPSQMNMPQQAGPQAQSAQLSQTPQVDLSQIQGFDWIAGFLSSVNGAGPNGLPPQANGEPGPSATEMDATWRALVQQLGVDNA